MRQVREDPHRQTVPHGASAELLVSDAAPHYRPPLNEVSATDRRLPWCSDSGAELLYPDRLVWPTPWVGHIPFAGWLIEAVRPRVVVELGVHSGNSYCAFLQAIQFLSLSSECYGIDHWKGDEHSDYYGDDVFTELRAYHDARYGTFSTLIRSTFEDALESFSDGSIDLLHIDGFHTYDAVARDFTAWLPKTSSRGVVLFHDITVRERNFGAWRFWAEVEARYPTFSFIHSHGLGVAYVGTEPPPLLIRPLLGANDGDTVRRVRAYFARLGTSLLDRYERVQTDRVAAQARASDMALETARAEARTLAETQQALRMECEKAAARGEVLDRELIASRNDLIRRTEAIDSLQGELGAARAEAARLAQSVSSLQQERLSLRAEAARAVESTVRLGRDLEAAKGELAHEVGCVAALQQELEGARADVARFSERCDALQRELAAARDETARQSEAACALQQQCAALESELASHVDAASRRAGEHDARVAQCEDDLRAARAENARQLAALAAAQATTEQMGQQIARLEHSVASAQQKTAEALAQRDRASLLLRQQIATTAMVQRELTADSRTGTPTPPEPRRRAT